MIELIRSKTRACVIFLICLFGCMREVSAWGFSGRFSLLPHHVCPSEDPDTHQCFQMTSYNTSCVVTSIKGCIPFLQGCRWHLTLEAVPCTVFSCEESCCDGWIEDENGICSLSDSSNTEVHCLNGGQMEDGGNSCNCPSTFTGNRCETPVCDEPCLHGGKCEVVDGKRQCVCPSKFYTQPSCEQVTCKESCENGGECIPDGVLSRCKCPPGYQGDRCQYELNIHCPVLTASLNMGSCGSMNQQCEQTHHCPANQICCYNGCVGECVNPTNTTCHFEDKYYNAGETFSPETCKRCVCQPWGEVQCTKVECPTTDCEGGHSPISVEGHCCKICPDTEITEDEGPIFENCPTRFITINVEEDGKTAILPVQSLGLFVTSHDGTSLGISFSRKKFAHSKSPDIKKNMHIVTAYSECDANGRRAECNFMVIVRDPQSPVFTSCPMEIFAFDDEEIDWSDPVATDNVGVFKIQADGDEVRHTVLQAGTYTVSYSVWDFDQNQAICAFAIHVFEKGSNPLNYPKQLKRREQRKEVSLAAIMGSVFGVTFLITVVIYLVVCLTKKRPVLPGPAQRQNSAENHIYAVCGHSNHSYQNVGKLPPYSLPTNPPPYEEIDHSFENPPIYEEIPNQGSGVEPSYANVDSGYPNPSYQEDTREMKYMKL